MQYGLSVLERDDIGELTEVAYLSSPYARDVVALSPDDSLVFVWGQRGAGVVDVGDPSEPVLLDTIDALPGETRWSYPQCRFATARGGRSAADAFCSSGGAYALEWRDGELALTDVVAQWHANRYNDVVPPFRNPHGFAASPDGRHAYVSTADQGILVFERVGNTASAGDNRDEAKTVRAFPWSWSDELGHEDGGHVFRIEVPGRGVLTAYTDGATDTRGTLRDTDGAVVAEDDDSGRGKNFEMKAGVDAGTYELEVRGYDGTVTGVYTLWTDFAPDPR